MGERAAITDKKLGLDYDIYNKMNHQAQRTAIKAMEVHRQLAAASGNVSTRYVSQDKKLLVSV